MDSVEYAIITYALLFLNFNVNAVIQIHKLILQNQ